MTKKAPQDEKLLCILYETSGSRAELLREGETFRVRFAGSKVKDRTFDSLPSLMSGLHGIFVEIRMGKEGVRGFDALSKISEHAREDVLAASRKIHSALETV